jgi:two-component system, chemotaxis family, sensor kinase CheA
MIEDLELRSLFKTEGEEHIRLLEEGLLRLETNPTDGKTLEEVFRAAHSLKGGSGMLGLRNIERLAHGFEDALNAARQGKVVLSPGTIDQLCKQLDTMRQLVDEAVSDGPREATIASALEPISGIDATVHPARAIPAIIAAGEFETAIDLPEREAVQAPPDASARRCLVAGIHAPVDSFASIEATGPDCSARGPFWTLSNRHHACGTPEVGYVDETCQ